MSVLTLAIESAIRGGSIAILSDDELIASWSGDSGVSKAEELLPAIAELLKKIDLNITDIGRIAVSVGPGSFTGIRIGLSTVMGLADSAGIEAFGISTLKAIAKNANARSAVVPVGKHDIAWQTFYETHESEITVGSIDDLLKAKPSDPIFHSTILHVNFGSIANAFGEIKNERICKNAAVEIGRFAVASAENHLPLEPLYVQNPRYVSLF